MKYQRILDELFTKKRKEGKITFKRELKPQVLLYMWENEFAYRAPFRILPSNLTNKDAITTKIEMKYPEFVKRMEYYMFCENCNPIVNEEIEVRSLTYKEENLLINLHDKCTQEENDIANITIYENNLLGAFLNGNLVGVSSMDKMWGVYDVAVLVHPKYRGMKIAKTLVSIQTQKAIKEDGICMYRCDDFNEISYNVATALGYEKKIDVLFYELEENR